MLSERVKEEARNFRSSTGKRAELLAFEQLRHLSRLSVLPWNALLVKIRERSSTAFLQASGAVACQLLRCADTSSAFFLLGGVLTFEAEGKERVMSIVQRLHKLECRGPWNRGDTTVYMSERPQAISNSGLEAAAPGHFSCLALRTSMLRILCKCKP